jgi:hypothetical protein
MANLSIRFLSILFLVLLAGTPSWSQISENQEVWNTDLMSDSSEPAFYDGHYFEKQQSIAIVGVPRSAVNLKREAEIESTINGSKLKIRYCYERAGQINLAPNFSAIFYFEVNRNGHFENITADLLNTSGDLSGSLFECISSAIKSFHATSYPMRNTFRLLTSFKTK